MEHTVKAIEEDLANLAAMLAELGARALREVDDGLVAVMDGDRRAATTVIEADAATDALTEKVRAEVLRMIARWQPVADDLRRILASERIAGGLERIGDHAKTMAKRSLAFEHPVTGERAALIRRLGETVRAQVANALRAMDSDDAELAQQVWIADVVPDELYDDVFHHILAGMKDDESSIATLTQLLFVAKSLERIGDYATNIAEEVRFVVTGRAGREARPRGASEA